MQNSNGNSSRFLKRLRRRFVRNEDGAVTVEAVLWLPVFVFFFAIIVDFTMILAGQAQTLRVIQDTNRAVSVGAINLEEAEARIMGQLSRLSSNIAVSTSYDSIHTIVTDVTMPSRDLIATGILGAIANFDVRVRAQHYAEF